MGVAWKQLVLVIVHNHIDHNHAIMTIFMALTVGNIRYSIDIYDLNSGECLKSFETMIIVYFLAKIDNTKLLVGYYYCFVIVISKKLF